MVVSFIFGMRYRLNLARSAWIVPVEHRPLHVGAASLNDVPYTWMADSDE